MTKAANQPVITPIRILPRNVYKDQGFDLKVFGVNEMDLDNVKVLIEIVDAAQKIIYSETFIRDFKRGISSILDKNISSADMLGAYQVQLTLFDDNEKKISYNIENFNVFNANDSSIPPKSIAVHDPEGTLSNFLTSKDIDLSLIHI